MTDLRIVVDERELAATWVDANPGTRASIADALPLSGDAARWGDELYFDVPVDESPAETREEVPEGAVAYWPAGNALCLFWGPTPASQGNEPLAAGPVGVVAEIEDVSALADVDGSARIRVQEA